MSVPLEPQGKYLWWRSKRVKVAAIVEGQMVVKTGRAEMGHGGSNGRVW